MDLKNFCVPLKNGKVCYPSGTCRLADDCEERRKNWVVKPFTQAKHYDYIAEVLTIVVEAHHNDMSTSTLKMAIKELQPSSQLPFNIADASKLTKSDVTSEHQRRYSLNRLCTVFIHFTSAVRPCINFQWFCVMSGT